MANEQNLIPFGTGKRSESEEREMRSRGGVNSGETRRARKTLRAEMEALLSMPVKDKETGEETGTTVQEAIVAALIKQAARGNTRAFEIIRDTIGEKPVERVSLEEISQDTIDEVEKMVKGDDP